MSEKINKPDIEEIEDKNEYHWAVLINRYLNAGGKGPPYRELAREAIENVRSLIAYIREQAGRLTMSEVKRWGCFVLPDPDGDAHQISRPMDDGEWVKYEDYARLERAFKRLAERLIIQTGVDERKRDVDYWWKWALGLDDDIEFDLWLSTDRMAFNRKNEWWYIKDGEQWIKCHKNGNAGGSKGRAKELWEHFNQSSGGEG